MMIMTFAEVMDHVAQGFEALGALILIAGALWSLASGGVAWRQSKDGRKTYARVRQTLGGSLLLGLEVLVAADLVRTIAVAPTLDNVLILGLIVLIRTFLSFSLEIEITGDLPWRRSPDKSPNGPTGDSRKAPKLAGDSTRLP